jgi:type VI protein secretion system component Hcp
MKKISLAVFILAISTVFALKTLPSAAAPQSDRPNMNRPMPTGQAAQPLQGQNRTGQNISCSSLQFGLTMPASSFGGGMAGRPQLSAITCHRPIDQVSLELLTDGSRGTRMQSVTLTTANGLSAMLTSAAISGVQLTTEANSQPVAEISFSFEKMTLQQGAARADLEGPSR